MKKVLLSLIAATALAAAVTPAAAQSWDHGPGPGPAPGGYGAGPGYGGGPDYGRGGGGDRPIMRGDNLEARINMGVRSGQLSWREARMLRDQLRYAERMAYRYRADGVVTRWEQADLDRRFDAVSARLRFERHDNEYGYGYGDRGDDRGGWRH
ncbi:hypothetical protein [Phenylobacterium aquaticum]|uniref:hypothetical protein n=1 Tax=Phenylobacterium aquaticum TaxID=1763816 RepID=UPI0026EF79DF|nr:hypothetical protein [Phenylobacterium aquaticum]